MSLLVLGPNLEKVTIGDLIRHEYNPLSGYCRREYLVYNRTGAAITLANPMGYPVSNDGTDTTGSPYGTPNKKFTVAGGEAAITGLILTTQAFTALANNGTIRAAILERGPAIVDKSVIPLTDVSAGTMTLATIVTALQTLTPPILCVPRQPNTSTQTT